VTTKRIRKIKKRTFAISAAATIIPVNPSNPAMIATIKKIKTHESIANLLYYFFELLTIYKFIRESLIFYKTA
jgi:hypothetical protein